MDGWGHILAQEKMHELGVKAVSQHLVKKSSWNCFTKVCMDSFKEKVHNNRQFCIVQVEIKVEPKWPDQDNAGHVLITGRKGRGDGHNAPNAGGAYGGYSERAYKVSIGDHWGG